MGRIYIADLKVQETIKTLFSDNNEEFTNVGLIIGQFSSGKDYVVHVVRTPVVEGVSGSDEKLLSQSLLTHSRQVRQLLTGGMDILGMVVYTSTDQFKSSFNQYKQLLYSSYKVINKFDSLIHMPPIHQHRLLLHISSDNHKLSCRSFDTTDNKSMGSPGEWKFQSVLASFISLSCEYMLRRTIHVKKGGSDLSLESTLDSGLEQELTDIRESDMLFQGDLIEIGDGEEDDDDDDAGFIQVDKKEEKSVLKMSLESLKKMVDVNGGGEGDDGKVVEEKGVDGSDGGTDFNVDLVVNMSKSTDSPLESPLVERCTARILVNGMVSSRAFLHHKCTFSDALKALKTDIMRSLLTRCEFVCQDLIQSEEDQTDIQLVYESPIRVFASIHTPSNTTTPSTTTTTTTTTPPSLQLCDYLFQEETKEDSAYRLKDVLGLTTDHTNIFYSSETFPDTERLESDGGMEEMMDDYHGYSKQQCQGNQQPAAVIDLFRHRNQASNQASRFAANYATPLMLGSGVVVAALGVMLAGYWSLKSHVHQMLHPLDQPSS